MTLACPFGQMGRPSVAKRSCDLRPQEKIAAVHPASSCGPQTAGPNGTCRIDAHAAFATGSLDATFR